MWRLERVLRSFSLLIAFDVVPYLAAMPMRVSPALTL